MQTIPDLNLRWEAPASGVLPELQSLGHSFLVGTFFLVFHYTSNISAVVMHLQPPISQEIVMVSYGCSVAILTIRFVA